MINVEGLSKKFKLYHSPADRLREIVFRQRFHKEFQALDDVSFEVPNGETLGIIGPNGAGKSTLLKILSGIVIPDTGTITIDGKVTGLLELGTGFNYEMTGIENIYMNGTLIGMTKAEIDRKKQDIINFSELGEFIQEPIKTYSSGMTVRLAFSIAIHADPTCFLVDEALSVGDAYFQQKCMQRIQEFRAEGGSIIFVSHDLNAVMMLCDQAILLDQGKMISQGVPRCIVDLYIARICSQAHKGERRVSLIENSQEFNSHSNISTNEIDFISLIMFDNAGNAVMHIHGGEEVLMTFSFLSHRLIEDPAFGILIRNRYGMAIFGTNTYLMGQKIDPVLPEVRYEVTFRFRVSLQADEYLVTIAVDNKGKSRNSFDEYLLRLNDIALLKVLRNEKEPYYEGVTDLHPVFRIEKCRQELNQGS